MRCRASRARAAEAALRASRHVARQPAGDVVRGHCAVRCKVSGNSANRTRAGAGRAVDASRRQAHDRVAIEPAGVSAVHGSVRIANVREQSHDRQAAAPPASPRRRDRGCARGRSPAHTRHRRPANRRKQERGPALQRQHRRPGRMGQGVSEALRALQEVGRHAAHQARRKRGRAANADPGRPALGRRALQGRRGQGPQGHLAGLRLLRGLPRGARPRPHARGPAAHEAPGGREAAGRVRELPRVDVPRVQAGGQRRHHQGLREDQRDALCGGDQARDPSGRLHRLPRRLDARAAGHPPGVHRRHARLQGVAWA